MKRRDFVKTLPAAAVVTVAACSPTGDAVAVDAPAPASAPQSSSGSSKPKGFSVADPTTHDDPGAITPYIVTSSVSILRVIPLGTA